MKTRTVFGAAVVAALVAAPSALADFEIAFSAVDLPTGGYANTDDYSQYAGRAILGVGWRDLVVRNDNLDEMLFRAGWGMTLPAYGTSFWYNGSFDVMLGIGSNTLDDVAWDVSVYDAEVAPANTWFGTDNLGAGFFGDLNGIGLEGELYFVLEGDPIPTPGALALLGLAGIATRRRRA